MTRKPLVLRGLTAKKLLEIANRYDYTITIIPVRYRKNGRSEGFIEAHDPFFRSLTYPRHLYSKMLDLDYLHRITNKLKMI